MPRYTYDPKALKANRLLSGIKPEQIAIDLGITYGAYISYETGRATPPFSRLLALCELFGCEPADLCVTEVDEEAEADAAAAESSRASRIAQGLPPQVTDPVALDQTAELLRTVH